MVGGDRAGRGDKSERRHNNLIAGRNVQRLQSHFQGGSSGGHAQRIGRAHHLGRLALQLRYFVRLIDAVEAERCLLVQYLQDEFTLLIAYEPRAG